MSVPADQGAMDFHAPRPSVVERIRMGRTLRRIDRQAFGFTTRNFHRNEKLHQSAFAVLVLLSVAGLVGLIAA